MLQTPTGVTALSARDLMQVMARYREPSHVRSVFELVATAAPFACLWVAAWLALSVSYWLTLAISVLAAGFLVRLFMIQHDCGHGAFFGRKVLDDWLGRALGVVTLTPYDVWRRSHSVHHATSGNLARRGIGDIETLTVAEYVSLPVWRRWLYRLYRNPLVMFGLGPAYLFLLQNRLPFGFMSSGWRYWVSAMATNVAILGVGAGMIYLVGFGTFLLVHIPITILAASIGVWLFYVQHQFEHTFWADDETWTLQEAALYGSSYYDLPQPLRWLTANIGMHHLHHLYSRIPFYRLPQVLRDFPELGRIRRLTLWQSLACVRLSLWDEGRRKLISFREAREADCPK